MSLVNKDNSHSGNSLSSPGPVSFPGPLPQPNALPQPDALSHPGLLPQPGPLGRAGQKGGAIHSVVDSSDISQSGLTGKLGPMHVQRISGQVDTGIRPADKHGVQHFNTKVVMKGGGKDFTVGNTYFGFQDDGSSLDQFHGSYAPPTRYVHAQCGGRRTRRNRPIRVVKKGRKRTVRRRKAKRTKRRIKRKVASKRRRHTIRRHRRRHRQRGGAGHETNSYSADMEPGVSGNLANPTHFIPTNNCFDDYNHYTATTL